MSVKSVYVSNKQMLHNQSSLEIPCRNTDLKTWLIDEQLFVFSTRSGQLYGFDSAATALFFMLDAGETKSSLLLAYPKHGTIIAQMDALLSGSEVIHLPKPDPFDGSRYPPASDLGDADRCFGFDTFSFALRCEVPEVVRMLMPVVGHLQCESVAPDIIIEISGNGDVYAVRINAQPVHQGVALLQLAGVLQDLLRITFYRSEDYLIALHAGALSLGDQTVILPAASGSGKSTLLCLPGPPGLFAAL